MSAVDVPDPTTSYQQSGNLKSIDQMNPKQLVDLNNEWFDRVIDNRKHVERMALLATAFYLGQQYVVFSGTRESSRLVTTPRKKGRVRTVEQLIEPAVRAEVARLLRSRPQGVVIPQGMDPSDYEAAQAADDLLSHVWRNNHWDDFLEDAVLWSIMAGTGHIGISWDTSKVDSQGMPGDFVFRSLSPFEFGVPSVRKHRLEDQQYVMVTKAYELDEIEARWGVSVQADRSEKFGSFDERLTSIILDSTSTSSSTSTYGSKNSSQKLAIVKETWIKPGYLAPEGAVLITANDQILDLQVWPEWTKGNYPFCKLDYTKVPGTYWSKGLVQSLIPIQRRHNRAASIIVESMNLMSQLSVAVPRNTNVKQTLGGKATIFEVPPGAVQPVTNIIPAPIGQMPFLELENTRAAARDIAYQHEVTKGTTPPNVRSGTAINALKELDDSASSIPIRNIERATQRVGNHILSIVQEQWDEPRMVIVLGETADIERKSFIKGTDISGQYYVMPGSAWPYSKAERQNMVLNALERGLLSPEEALRHAEMGTPRTILSEREVDLRHARRENQKYEAMSAINPETGQPDPEFIQQQAMEVMPEDWHHHEAHIAIHNRLRKSPEFEKWPSWKQQILQGHILGHMTVLRQRMQAQMQAGIQPQQGAQ